MTTREEVTEMACEAGFGGNQRRTLAVKLERLVALAVAAERRRCAQVALTQFRGSMLDRERSQLENEICHRIAKAIYGGGEA